jgi:hypothetical protein
MTTRIHLIERDGAPKEYETGSMAASSQAITLKFEHPRSSDCWPCFCYGSHDELQASVAALLLDSVLIVCAAAVGEGSSTADDNPTRDSTPELKSVQARQATI